MAHRTSFFSFLMEWQITYTPKSLIDDAKNTPSMLMNMIAWEKELGVWVRPLLQIWPKSVNNLAHFGKQIVHPFGSWRTQPFHQVFPDWLRDIRSSTHLRSAPRSPHRWTCLKLFLGSRAGSILNRLLSMWRTSGSTLSPCQAEFSHY